MYILYNIYIYNTYSFSNLLQPIQHTILWGGFDGAQES